MKVEFKDGTIASIEDATIEEVGRLLDFMRPARVTAPANNPSAAENLRLTALATELRRWFRIAYAVEIERWENHSGPPTEFVSVRAAAPFPLFRVIPRPSDRWEVQRVDFQSGARGALHYTDLGEHPTISAVHELLHMQFLCGLGVLADRTGAPVGDSTKTNADDQDLSRGLTHEQWCELRDLNCAAMLALLKAKFPYSDCAITSMPDGGIEWLCTLPSGSDRYPDRKSCVWLDLRRYNQWQLLLLDEPRQSLGLNSDHEGIVATLERLRRRIHP